MLNDGLRQARANIAATVIDIGMPQNRKLARPTMLRTPRIPSDVPKAERTTSSSGDVNPSWRMNMVPTFALSAKPVKYANPMIMSGTIVVNSSIAIRPPWLSPSISKKRSTMATIGAVRFEFCSFSSRSSSRALTASGCTGFSMGVTSDQLFSSGPSDVDGAASGAASGAAASSRRKNRATPWYRTGSRRRPGRPKTTSLILP